jgi:hypothetical protein
MIMLPQIIGNFLKELREKGVPVWGSDRSEEEQEFPLTFEEEQDSALVESETFEIIEVCAEVEEEIIFRAFLDGVQRTMILPYRIPLPNGALVPLHVAHIAAGILLRDEKGRLHMDPSLIASRVLLLGPFQGIQETGGPSFEGLESNEVIKDIDDQIYCFPLHQNEWVICDITFPGISADRVERREKAFCKDKLFNEREIRSRALGRVAVLRQILEFIVLLEFRKKEPNAFILVDGPLFFLDKWRRKFPLSEENLLRNAVGLIKTLRLRPKDERRTLRIEQLSWMGEGYRSPVLRLTREVDIKGGKFDEEDNSYAGAHLTWYTRLRLSRTEPPYGLQGLIRLDVHRSTFGIKLADALEPRTFQRYKIEVDKITRAVWREKWPGISRNFRETQIYPIEQVERILKASIYPRRLLMHLLNIQ